MNRWRPQTYKAQNYRYRNPQEVLTSYPNYYSEPITGPTYQSHLHLQNQNGDHSLDMPSNANAIQGQLTSLQSAVLNLSENLDLFRRDQRNDSITMSEDLYEIYLSLECLSNIGKEPMDTFTPLNQKVTSKPVSIIENKTITKNFMQDIPYSDLAKSTSDVLKDRISQLNTLLLQKQQQEASCIGDLDYLAEVKQNSPSLPSAESIIKKHQKQKEIEKEKIKYPKTQNKLVL